MWPTLLQGYQYQSKQLEAVPMKKTFCASFSLLAAFSVAVACTVVAANAANRTTDDSISNLKIPRRKLKRFREKSRQ